MKWLYCLYLDMEFIEFIKELGVKNNIVMGLVYPITVTLIIWIFSIIFKLKPKLFLKISTKEHQVNKIRRIDFGWDDWGKDEFTVSFEVKIFIENISNSIAYTPILTISKHNFQFDIQQLDAYSIQPNERIELKGHYYYNVNSHEKPKFVEFEDFKNLEFELRYKNSIGYWFRSKVSKGEFKFSLF